MRRAATALVGSVGVVALLAGCGTGDDEPASAPASSRHPGGHGGGSHGSGGGAATTGATTEAATAGTSAPAPVDGPPFPDSTAPQQARNSGDWDLVLQDVRVGDHEGYDRIVLEFSGTGVPGWSVKYVDEAVLDASGKKVALDGDSVLDVYASGTTYPEGDADYFSGPRRFRPAEGGDVEEVYVAGTFEGYTQVLAGLAGEPTPFRVFTLTGPPRLVVDVADD